MAVATASIGRNDEPAWLWPIARLLFCFALIAAALHVADLKASARAELQPSEASAASQPQPEHPATRTLELDRPLAHGDYAWSEDGAPDGPVEIVVDLSAQTLSVFRGGHEIGRAVILYGEEGSPTPLGSFTITEKNRDHVSNIYDAPMPYMLRLTNDGIAIHGSIVKYGAATRGCVGVPDEFAAMLFRIAGIGDRVTIVGSGGFA